MKTRKIKFHSIGFSRDGLPGYVKSPILWGNTLPNTGYPICYFRKPKWMTDKDWQVILDNIHFALPMEHKFTYTEKI